MHLAPKLDRNSDKASTKNLTSAKMRRDRGRRVLHRAAAASVELLEDRRLLTAIVAPADPVVYGDTVSGPLAPRPGHSLYVSGVTSTGGFVSQWGSASAITPNTTNDLVLNVTPFSNNYHATSEGAGNLPTPLTNGITQTQVSPGIGNQPAGGDGGSSDPSNATNITSDTSAQYFMSYNLGAASGHISPTGYDLSEIDVITGHQDGRVAISLVDVLVEPVGSSHFISLSGGAGFTLGNAGQVPITIGAAQMAIVNSVAGQPIATNIQAVELSVLNPQTFFREFVTTGTPSALVSPPTGVPTGVGVTFDPNVGNTVSWSAPATGATGYSVLRATSVNGPYTVIGSATGQTSFIDPNVQALTSYSYEVIASGNGDSAASAPASIVTPNFGAPARVVPPDPVIFGDTVTGPLAPQPGHSFYVSGNNSAGVAISQWANTSAITPNIQNDLVLNVAPSDIGGFVTLGEGLPAGTPASPATHASSIDFNDARLMTNGITQNQAGTFPGSFPPSGAVAATGDGNASDASNSTNIVSATTAFAFSYTLGGQPGATPSSTGYDLSEIDVITGHQDLRTAMPLLDILVEPVGSNQFYSLSLGRGFSLTTVPDGSGGTTAIVKGSAQMAIVSTVAGQPLATNIQAVKFSELTTGNPATFFRELVVAGNASAALPPTPPAPANVAASPTTYPTITWDPSSGAVNYTINRSTSINGPYAPVGAVLNHTSFIDTTAFPNTTYYYEILASGNGDSALSLPSNPVTTSNFGANAYFFQNQLWTGTPTRVEQLPQINYGVTVAGTAFPIPASIAPTNFSVMIEGKVTTDLAGNYVFGANTDDSGYLYVNGQLVSTNVGTHAPRPANVTLPIALAAHTPYDFVFLENQGGNTWGFQMYWQKPTAANTLGPVTPVPGIQMTPSVDTPPAVGAVTTTALSDKAVQLSWAPTGDLSSYGYVIQRAPADVNGNPIGGFTTVTTAFSGPTTLTAQGALTWGISTFTDTTAAPNTMYVYQVGAILPGQTGQVAFSPISTPVVTSAAPVVPVLANATLSVPLGASDVCTIAADGAGNIVITEGGVSTPFPLSSVQSLSVTGVAGATGIVNLNSVSLSGAITIDQVTDVTIGGAVSAAQIHIGCNNITVNGAITTIGPVAPGTPQVDLQTNNNLTINSSISCTGPINLVADRDLNSTGTLSVSTGATVTSSNNPITTHFSALSINGTINAGSGDVTYAGTGNSFNATGYQLHTVSSGTIMLTSGIAGLTRPSAANADTWSSGASGTVFYNFPNLTNGFTVNSTGINTSAGNANLKISVPVLITISGPLITGTGQVTLSAANVNINNSTLTSPGVTDSTGTLTVRGGQSLTLIAPSSGPVTLTANMIVSSGATLHVNGGLTLNGTITVNGGTVSFDGTQTLSGGGQILFGAGNERFFVTNGTLTIGSGITVTGASGAVGNVNITKNDSNADAIVNLGTFDANQPGLIFSASFFTNLGTVRASDGGAMGVFGLSGSVGAGYSATGAGSKLTLSGGFYTVNSGLSASAGATLELDGNWTNGSTITLDNSAINLGGAFLTDGIGTINAVNGPSTVNITGFLDNRASSNNVISQGTLALSPSIGTWNLAAAGTIMGGTITGAALNSNTGGTLDGVTLATPMNIHSASVTVLDGLTLTDGTTVSLFSTSAAPAALAFGNTQMVGMISGQGLIVFNGVNPTDTGLMPIGQNAVPATLTIGSGVSIVTGTGSAVLGSGIAGNDIVNNGTIGSSGAQSITLLDPLDPTSAGNIVGSPHTTAYWTGSGNDNDWNDALNWSTTVVPTSDQAVVINGNPGANTITITSGAQSIFSLASSWPIFLPAGSESLTVATSANLSANLTLAGGTLIGGTYSESSGGHILMSGNATLDGVTLNTGIGIGSGQTLDVRDGLTLAGSSALTLSGGAISFDGTQTLAGTGSVVFGAAGGNTLLVNSGGGASGTLTIAPGITLSSAAPGGSGTDTFGAGDANPDSIVNQGAMIFTTTNSVTPPQTIAISGVEFTNQGTVTLTKSTLRLAAPSHAWSNTGTINLTNATIAAAVPATDTLTNSGTISGNAFFDLSLVNSNVINLFGASVRITGPVTNTASGNIQITRIQAVFNGFMTDAGTIKTTGATARYLGGASVSGSYISDPSSNFFSDLTISGNGAISSGQPDTTGTSDLFVVTGNLANTSSTASDTSGAQLEFQGTSSHQVTGSFSFSTLTVDPGNAVTLAPAAGTTFSVTNVVNNGALDIQSPLTSTGTFTNNGAVDVQAPTTTGAVTNNNGASLQINAAFAAPTIENAGGASLTINAPQVTTTVDNQGTLAVNASAPVTLTPTSTGIVIVGTTTTASAVNATYGMSTFTLSANVAAGDGATAAGIVTFTVMGAGNVPVGPQVTAPVAGGVATASFVFAGLNTGAYTIRADFHAAAGSNQTDSAFTTTLTISPAALTVRANDATKVYGTADPAFAAGFTGLVNGDITASLGGSLSFTTTEPSGNAPVGSYSITPSGLSSPNYVITFVAGTLSVTPASLTVVVDNKSKIYGQPNPTLSGTVTGVVSGDTVTPAYSTAPAGSGAGTYAITATSNNPNYLLTVTPGTLTIAPAPLAVTANPAAKVYGTADPAFTASITGLVNGDTASSLSGALSFVTSEPAGNAPVGTYAITGQGLASPNYQINYVAGALTVTSAALTVTANSTTKVYGASDPAFSASYAGFVAGDSAASLAGSLSFVTTEPGVGNAPAGTYAITPSGLTSTNYNIHFVPGTLTITPAALTIRATSVTKAYGTADPAFTVTYSGLASGDTAASLGGTLTFNSNEPSGTAPVGTYTITPSGLSSPNYAIAFVPGTLTVVPSGTQVDYVGATYATAAQNGAATAMLRADVKTAPGIVADIRNASVSFLVYDGANLVATVSGSPVGLVTAGDLTTGSSTATWNTSIGTLASKAYRVVVVVGGSFTGTTAQSTTLLVERATSQPIAGAGDVIATAASAGTYGVPAGTRVGYAFAVQNVAGQLRGTADILFQRKTSDGKLHSYLVTSTSIVSYGFDPVSGKASILAAANLIDVTNPLAPVTIATGVTLQFSAFDSGAAHPADSIGITVWSGSTLLFSSDWDGLQTLNDHLADGLNQI